MVFRQPESFLTAGQSRGALVAHALFQGSLNVCGQRVFCYEETGVVVSVPVCAAYKPFSALSRTRVIPRYIVG